MIRTPVPSALVTTAVAAAVALTAGCGSDPALGGPDGSPPEGAVPPEGVPPNAQRVSFTQMRELTTPVSGIPDRRRLVIEDQGAWADFWQEFNAALVPTPPVPGLDFDRDVIVVATMGTQPTSGYRIDVGDVFEAGGELFAVVVSTSPAAACITTPVLTAPATAVVVPRRGIAIDFVEISATAACP